MQWNNQIIRIIPKLTTFNNGADYFAGVPFDFIKGMSNSINTRSIDISVYKYQKIPVGKLGKIVSGSGSE